MPRAQLCRGKAPRLRNVRSREVHVAGKKTAESDVSCKLVSRNCPWGVKSPGRAELCLAAVLPLRAALRSLRHRCSWARCPSEKPALLPSCWRLGHCHGSVTDSLSSRSFPPESSALGFPIPWSLVGARGAFTRGSTAQVMAWRDNKGGETPQSGH